ncbi:MAG TPA: MarR family winged helix-turn-helix transcriptional regulator [Ruminiclostridium sp.]|nr:MarR family winged helix-turn-helix transcriptional regulator [Ruminiclostridium sp.]
MPEQYVNRIVSVLYRHGQRFLARKFKEYSIPFEVGQFPFIMQVYRNPGITQEGISANAAMDKGTTAHNIKQLEKLGLVQREIDANDRRVNHIYPTPKALEVKDKVFKIIDELHGILYQGFSEEEIPLIISLLSRIKINMENYFEK